MPLLEAATPAGDFRRKAEASLEVAPEGPWRALTEGAVAPPASTAGAEVAREGPAPGAVLPRLPAVEGAELRASTQWVEAAEAPLRT